MNFQELFCPTKGVGGKCYDQWVMQRRRWFGKGDSFKIQKSLLDFWGAPYKLRPFSLPYCFHRISSEGTRKKTVAIFGKPRSAQSTIIPRYKLRIFQSALLFGVCVCVCGSGSGFRWWLGSVGEVNWVCAS